MRLPADWSSKKAKIAEKASGIVAGRYPDFSDAMRGNLASAIQRAVTKALRRHGKDDAELTLTRYHNDKKMETQFGVYLDGERRGEVVLRMKIKVKSR